MSGSGWNVASGGGGLERPEASGQHPHEHVHGVQGALWVCWSMIGKRGVIGKKSVVERCGRDGRVELWSEGGSLKIMSYLYRVVV